MTATAYYALRDPDASDTMTYWRRTANGRLEPWPKGATYGPVLWRRDLPPDRDTARAVIAAHHARVITWRAAVEDQVQRDVAAAAARFADFTTRCFCCGRELTDPLSKTLGIGPDCRRHCGLDVATLAAHATPLVAAAHAAGNATVGGGE